jgi:hypothetical protein
MQQIQGVEGEAVVSYCEPLTTQEMRYHRLSRRVNKPVIFSFVGYHKWSFPPKVPSNYEIPWGFFFLGILTGLFMQR